MYDKNFLLDQIKLFVSIQDVFDKYVGTQPDFHGRYKCPFNNSEDRRNFAIKNNKIWHCFSCGTTGDQITLVQKIFDIPFNEAIQKIAEDFHLSKEKDEKVSIRTKIEMQRRILQREKDKRYAQLFATKTKELFNKIIDKCRELDDIIYRTNPTQSNLQYYPYGNNCVINMEARCKREKLEEYIDILSETTSPKSELCCFDKDELHKKSTELVNAYIKGEFII